MIEPPKPAEQRPKDGALAKEEPEYRREFGLYSVLENPASETIKRLRAGGDVPLHPTEPKSDQPTYAKSV